MAIWIIAGLVSGFIKGLCGVGDAPLFSSILSFAHNNIDISPVNLLPSFPINLFITWQNRKSLQTKIWLPMALLLIAGCIPGTLLLKSIDTGTLKLIFGIFITIVGFLMLYNELTGKKIRRSRVLLITVGILAGLGSGLFGVGVRFECEMRKSDLPVIHFSMNDNALYITGYAKDTTVRTYR